jgi:hypothetical protein
MGEKQASAFDERVRGRIKQQILEGTVQVVNGRIQGECIGTIVWGKPKRLK